MSTFLGDWVKAIAGAAIICGAAISITPKGSVKNVLKLICGLVLVCSMAGPLINPSGELLSMSVSEYRQRAKEIAQQGENETNSLNRRFIEEEISAYISDKALDMGESIQDVSVSMNWSKEGFWYPAFVTIQGEVSETGKKRLESLIEGEIGLAKENQHWSEYGS
ncbi:MAG: hypothetical protein GX025_00645 [Clostridiales bacterium]|jgi:hypothetical protein|nr:hypothetical protein [Clostridiales bacterium]